LLDYFSKNEINNSIIDYEYNNKKYIHIEIYKDRRFEIYENMSFSIDPETYIIYALGGFNFYDDGHEECFADVDTISDDLKKIFINTTIEENFKNHEADISGESKVKETNFWFDNDDLVSVECYNWSNKITNELGWIDNLSVGIYSGVYIDWINNEAY